MCHVPLAFHSVHGWGKKISENEDRSEWKKDFQSRGNKGDYTWFFVRRNLVFYSELEEDLKDGWPFC